VHRFFLSPNAFHGEQVIFPPDIARQIRPVLRLHPGDEVLALAASVTYLAWPSTNL